MMKDGGPAFPAIIPIEHSDMQGKDYPNYTESGMSLRDWFAGQALQALSVQAHVSPPAAEYLATSAYNIADAMLEERKERDPASTRA